MIKEPEQFARTAIEWHVFSAIDMCGMYVWRTRHDIGRGRVPPEKVAEAKANAEVAYQDQLTIIRTALPRFGIPQPLDEKNSPTRPYWQWYRWWDQWKRSMPDAEWREFQAAERQWERRGGPRPDEIERWRPPGRWQDHDGEYRNNVEPAGTAPPDSD